MRRSSRFNRPGLTGSSRSALLLNNDGDGSTLTLDFTTGVLDPRLTFSRLSGGTYVGNDGFVYGVDFATSSSLAIGTGSKSVTLTATGGVSRQYEIGQTVYIANGANNMRGAVTAYNASTQVLTINATSTSGSGSFTSWIVGNASARFDYDPTALTPRGLLIEGSATNNVTNSDTLPTGTSWTANSVTRTNVSTLTPDGNTTTTTCGISHTGSGSFRSAAITVSANTAYTFSFWAKNNGGSVALYRAFNVSGSADIVSETSYFSQINSSTWTRIQFTFTTPVGCTSVYVYPLSQSSGTSNVLVWGAQLEAGNGASSYIPTGASTATRNRDELTLTNLSSIAFSQTSGTAFAHVEVREKATGNFIPYGSFDTSGGGRCWWWLRHNRDASVGTRMLGTVFNSGGSTAITTSNYQYNSGNGGLVKFATSLDTATSSVVYVIGGTSPQTTTASAFTLATAAQWSVNVNSDVGATDLGSLWMRSFKYWPTNLPNATLQSLTT